jgi:hypothetical protein
MMAPPRIHGRRERAGFGGGAASGVDVPLGVGGSSDVGPMSVGGVPSGVCVMVFLLLAVGSRIVLRI